MTKEEVLAELYVQNGVEAPAKVEEAATQTTDDKVEEVTDSTKTPTTEKEKGEPTGLKKEDVLAFLKEQGIAINDFDELKPKDVEIDPEVAKEQREADKLNYGIKKGLFKQKDYDNYVVDNKDHRNLVFGAFYEDFKADDPEATDEEISAAFLDKYHQNEDTNSRKYQRGVSEIEAAADAILKNKYKGIFDLEGDYSSFEQDKLSEKETAKKISLGAAQYAKDVEETVDALRKRSFKIPELGDIEIEVPAEEFAAIKKDLLGETMTKHHILSEYKKEGLKDVIDMAMLKGSFDKIVQSVASQIMLKAQKGVRGVITNETVVAADTSKLTDLQKEAIAENKRRAGIQ